MVIVGSTAYDETTLLRQLRLTRVGEAYEPGRLDADIELNLKAFLKEHGFMSSEVKWKAEPGSGGNVDIWIEVSEGPQYRLGKLEIAGDTVFSRDQIRSLFDLKEGDILNFKKIKDALDQVKRLYLGQGYINWTYMPEMSTNGTTMNLRFTMVGDKQFHTGAIGFVGCGDQEEENQLRSVITLRLGETFRTSDVDASVTAINKLGIFKTIGEADVEVHPDENKGLITIVFWLKPRE